MEEKISYAEKYPNIAKIARRILEIEKANGKDATGILKQALILADTKIKDEK